LYKLIQYVLRFYLPIFFKKIEFRGLENIPQDKPVIFAVNHQNAFLDGILVALRQRRPIFFLTRSDVFKGRWVVKIFKLLNLVPIFRAQDGTGDITTNNRQTFKYCIRELEKRKPILIFPEGESEPIHHLFDLKKGVARLAFAAEVKNNFKLNLHVVPVVINYENHFIGGKRVFVNYLNPILISEYKNLYSENKVRSMTVFLKKMQKQMKENMIHISGDYVKFKRRYWRGIIRQSRNDKEIIAAVRSIPQRSSELLMKEYIWKQEKYKYNKPQSLLTCIFYFLVCFPGFLLFSPTIILTTLIHTKVKDESFYLSVTAISWLFFGTTQITMISFYIWSYADWDIVASSLIIMLSIAYLTLRNFYKPFKVGM
jgi:1-acyl-sn-glycerol-3-phosphate acyltransferase